MHGNSARICSQIPIQRQGDHTASLPTDLAATLHIEMEEWNVRKYYVLPSPWIEIDVLGKLTGYPLPDDDALSEVRKLSSKDGPRCR